MGKRLQPRPRTTPEPISSEEPPKGDFGQGPRNNRFLGASKRVPEPRRLGVAQLLKATRSSIGSFCGWRRCWGSPRSPQPTRSALCPLPS